MQIVNYTTDLTDAQWKLLQPMLPARKKRGRQPTDPRRVINAIVYILKGGIQWRLLPAGFPPWQTVYHIFRRWIADNTWQSIHDRLRAMVRNAAGKEVPHPRFHTRSASGTNLLRISPREGTGVCASSEKERKRKKLEPNIFLPIGLRSNGRPLALQGAADMRHARINHHEQQTSQNRIHRTPALGTHPALLKQKCDGISAEMSVFLRTSSRSCDRSVRSLGSSRFLNDD